MFKPNRLIFVGGRPGGSLLGEGLAPLDKDVEAGLTAAESPAKAAKAARDGVKAGVEAARERAKLPNLPAAVKPLDGKTWDQLANSSMDLAAAMSKSKDFNAHFEIHSQSDVDRLYQMLGTSGMLMPRTMGLRDILATIKHFYGLKLDGEKAKWQSDPRLYSNEITNELPNGKDYVEAMDQWAKIQDFLKNYEAANKKLEKPSDAKGVSDTIQGTVKNIFKDFSGAVRKGEWGKVLIMGLTGFVAVKGIKSAFGLLGTGGDKMAGMFAGQMEKHPWLKHLSGGAKTLAKNLPGILALTVVADYTLKKSGRSGFLDGLVGGIFPGTRANDERILTYVKDMSGFEDAPNAEHMGYIGDMSLIDLMREKAKANDRLIMPGKLGLKNMPPRFRDLRGSEEQKMKDSEGYKDFGVDAYQVAEALEADWRKNEGKDYRGSFYDWLKSSGVRNMTVTERFLARLTAEESGLVSTEVAEEKAIKTFEGWRAERVKDGDTLEKIDGDKWKWNGILVRVKFDDKGTRIATLTPDSAAPRGERMWAQYDKEGEFVNGSDKLKYDKPDLDDFIEKNLELELGSNHAGLDWETPEGQPAMWTVLKEEDKLRYEVKIDPKGHIQLRELKLLPEEEKKREERKKEEEEKLKKEEEEKAAEAAKAAAEAVKSKVTTFMAAAAGVLALSDAKESGEETTGMLNGIHCKLKFIGEDLEISLLNAGGGVSKTELLKKAGAKDVQDFLAQEVSAAVSAAVGSSLPVRWNVAGHWEAEVSGTWKEVEIAKGVVSAASVK